MILPLDPADLPPKPDDATADQVIGIVLACTAATFLPAPPVTGLSFVVLSNRSTLEDIREGLDTNAWGFDPSSAAATPEEATAFRAELVSNRAFTAKLNGEAVAAGMFMPPVDGISELVGITTLAGYQRMGIGAALTSEVMRVAFDHGVDTAILLSDHPTAYRLYLRLGFEPVARLVYEAL